jgi:putative SOS response-associated peptidase YedK
MLTINADQNAVMKQFHKPEDEKRSLIIIPPEFRNDWLHADHKTAQELIHEMSVNDFHGLPAPLVRKLKSKPMNNELF